MSLASRTRFGDSDASAMTEKGHPTPAGRILATLLICDPPHQTLDQLCETLEMEPQDANEALDFLVDLGHLERLGLPWEPVYVFRLNHDFPGGATPQWLAKVSQRHRLGMATTDLPDDLSDSAVERLSTVRAYTNYMLRGIRELAEAWPSVREHELRRQMEEAAPSSTRGSSERV